MNRILRLDQAGTPTAWLTREQAATLYVREQVLWEIGDRQWCVFGGINRATGQRSVVELSPIVAVKAVQKVARSHATVSNRMLFRRDNFLCMYCGGKFSQAELTRDHITPRSRGGSDRWENLVAACRRCNHRKADRTPEEAGMALLAIPFRPNAYEAMYLDNQRIVADQMAYLEQQFSGRRDWLAA